MKATELRNGEKQSGRRISNLTNVRSYQIKYRRQTMGRQRRKRQHKDKTTSKVKSTKRRTKGTLHLCFDNFIFVISIHSIRHLIEIHPRPPHARSDLDQVSPLDLPGR